MSNHAILGFLFAFILSGAFGILFLHWLRKRSVIPPLEEFGWQKLLIYLLKINQVIVIGSGIMAGMLGTGFALAWGKASIWGILGIAVFASICSFVLIAIGLYITHLCIKALNAHARNQKVSFLLLGFSIYMSLSVLPFVFRTGLWLVTRMKNIYPQWFGG